MGVKYLWDIIDEAKNKETLECMRGKVISVDLSIWIVEAIKTLQFKTAVLKPHLRNIFYRIICLRRLGIKLIFVTEGKAPELKQDTMKQRNEQRYGTKANAKRKVGRSRFQRTVDECCHLLDLFGIPHVTAVGEAEAMCAVLDKFHLTDGCLTNDGDFFLYGGEVVYRDFGIDPKDPHVLCYNVNTIKQRVGLDQKDMVGLALLCGCDYTKGVTGVGKGLVTKLLQERSFSEDFIVRFHKWLDVDFFKNNEVLKSELDVARKALKLDNFLNKMILDEYLVDKDCVTDIRKKLKWGYPDIKGLQEFLQEKLEWPFEYTLSKVLQLSSSTYLEKIRDKTFYYVPIKPIRVVKTRCQHGVALVEIEWTMDEDDNLTCSKRWMNCPKTFQTLENQQVVLKVLPGMVEEFLAQKELKNKKGARMKKFPGAAKTDNIKLETSKDDELDDICEKIEKVNIKLQGAIISSSENLLNTNDKVYAKTSLPCMSSSEQDSSDEETVLPLSQRIVSKVLRQKTECSNSYPAQLDSLDKKKLVLSEFEKDSVNNNSSFKASTIKFETKLNGSKLCQDSPTCNDISTPILQIDKDTSVTKIKSISEVTSRKRIFLPLTDLTNFSQLSSSILCDSLERLDEYPTEQSKDTISYDENEILENDVMQSCDSSLSSTDDTPILTLADRLKTRAKCK